MARSRGAGGGRKAGFSGGKFAGVVGGGGPGRMGRGGPPPTPGTNAIPRFEKAGALVTGDFLSQKPKMGDLAMNTVNGDYYRCTNPTTAVWTAGV